MGGSSEIWQCRLEFEWVGGLHKHKCHGGSEENDVRGRVLLKFFAFEISVIDMLAYRSPTRMGLNMLRTLPRMLSSAEYKLAGVREALWKVQRTLSVSQSFLRVSTSSFVTIALESVHTTAPLFKS